MATRKPKTTQPAKRTTTKVTNAKEQADRPDKKAIAGIKQDALLLSGNVLIVLLIGFLTVIFGMGIKEILSPIVLFIILFSLLILFWRFTWAKILIFATSALFFVWIIIHAAGILVPVFFAILFAYLLSPLVERVRKVKYINKVGAVTIVTIPMIIIVSLLLVVLGNEINTEVQHFVKKMQADARNETPLVVTNVMEEKVTNMVTHIKTNASFTIETNILYTDIATGSNIALLPVTAPPPNTTANTKQTLHLRTVPLTNYSIAVTTNITSTNITRVRAITGFSKTIHSLLKGGEPFLNRIGIDIITLTTEIETWFSDLISDILSREGALLESLSTGAAGIGKGLSYAWKGINIPVRFLMNLFLTIVLTFYLLLDFSRIRENLSLLIPSRHKAEITRFIHASERIVNSYVRGMLLLSIIFSIVFYIALSFANIKYALILALIRGFLNLIPFIGVFIAFFIAIPVGLISHSVWWSGLIAVIIIYGIGQALDTGILAPKVLGEGTKLNPFVVIVSIFVFGFFFGIIGVFVAVPISGILRLLLRKLRANYLRSNFYRKNMG